MFDRYTGIGDLAIEKGEELKLQAFGVAKINRMPVRQILVRTSSMMALA